MSLESEMNLEEIESLENQIIEKTLDRLGFSFSSRSHETFESLAHSFEHSLALQRLKISKKGLSGNEALEVLNKQIIGRTKLLEPHLNLLLKETIFSGDEINFESFKKVLGIQFGKEYKRFPYKSFIVILGLIEYLRFYQKRPESQRELCKYLNRENPERISNATVCDALQEYDLDEKILDNTFFS